jgi:hypothetical protein
MAASTLSTYFQADGVNFVGPGGSVPIRLSNEPRVPSINNVPYNNALIALIYRGKEAFCSRWLSVSV